MIKNAHRTGEEIFPCSLLSLVTAPLLPRGRLHKSESYDLALRQAFILTSGVTSLVARRTYARRWSGLHQLDVSESIYDRLTADFHMQIQTHNCMNSKFAFFGLPANCFENTANTKAKIAKSQEN